MSKIAILTLALSLVGAGDVALAQRGTGDPAGVARDAAYDVRGLAGRIDGVEVGACANTTGRSVEGAHLLVAMPDGQTADVHLGPTDAEVVGRILDTADTGDEITAQVFRTDAMPFGAFAAVTVTVDDETFRLRGDDLRPAWAMGGAGARGPGAGGQARGPGMGRADGGPQAGAGAGRADGGPGRCWWDVPAGR